MVTSEHLLKGSVMRIATTVLVMRIATTVLVMIIAVTSIVITFALIGAVVGAIVALLLQTDLIPAALIGALGGFCSGLAFLLNAGLNGEEKGL